MNITVLQRTAFRHVANSLGRVAQDWLNPASPLRKDAVPALQVSTGFPGPMIEEALDAAFSELTEDKLLAFCASETAFEEGILAPEKVLHILAGNVFTAWLPGAAITLMLGAECALKPSSHESVFAPLWKRSVERVDLSLAQRIQIVRWESDLGKRYDVIVAYGSDATLMELKASVPASVHFVGYGHKFSVGIIWKEACTSDCLPTLSAQILKDIQPFGLQGCLSPKIIYMEEGCPDVFKGLESQSRVLPQMKIFDDWHQVKADLLPFKSQLSALGYAGPPERVAALKSDLEELGFSRVCPLGEMQRPPVTWRNGGLSLAEALTRR